MKPFGIDTIQEEERKEIARRALNNLLTSYADEADVFTEIIQNAYDSVKTAKEEGLYSNENSTPEITIVIGRRYTGAHYLFVKDNGTGMSKLVAEKLTVPGYSNGKQRGKTVGYKGVGASYFFAVSQLSSIKTISRENETTQYTVRGSYNWIKSMDEIEPVIDSEMFVPNFLKELVPTSRGTAIYFQFHEGMKPKNLNNIVIVGEGHDTELQNWMSYLSVKTSLGAAEKSEILSDLKINIYLDLGDNQYIQTWKYGEFNLETKTIGYPYPYNVFKVGEKKSVLDNLETHLKFRHERRHQAIFHRWTADEIIESTKNLEEAEIDALRQYLKWADGYLCYSVDVLKEVNKRLGGRSPLLKHGIRIVCDNSPQGRIIDLSLTSSQGLDRQSHIVLAFDNLELDTGRKISADEIIANAIAKIGQRIVVILKEYRWAMKKKERPDPSSDLEEWRNSVDSRSQTSLIRDFYTTFELFPVFRVDPDTEQEVIALFVSLLTSGILKGYQILAISGFKRYDALVNINFTTTPEFDFSDIRDVISIRSEEINIEGDAKVLEFKHNFDDLLYDFEEKIKSPSEIDILVCWNVPNINVPRGRIEPCYGSWKDHRIGYGISYIWYDENETSRFPIISLKNLLSELLSKKESDTNNPGLGFSILKQIENLDRTQLI